MYHLGNFMGVNKNIYNSFAVFFIVIIIIFSAIGVPALNFNMKKEEKFLESKNKNNFLFDYSESNIVFEFSFERPEIFQIKKQNKIYNIVSLEGFSESNNIGFPKLPIKTLNVLLPQGKTVESINIDKESSISLGKNFNIEIGNIPRILNERFTNEKDYNEIFNFDKERFYPEKLFENIGVHSIRGYNILTLNIFPVRYLYKTGELIYYDNLKVTINTKNKLFINELFRNDPDDESLLSNIINKECMKITSSYVNTNCYKQSRTFLNPSESYDYLIITNEKLKNSNKEFTFQDLADFKNSSGISTKIETVEYINKTYYGVDLEEKIRYFIKDAYNTWDIEYVLIGGDFDIVPARLLYVQSWPDLYGIWPYAHPEISNMPSDLYYSCLDGSFNSDGDENWGETNDGINGEDIDLRAEVYVGRACAGNCEEVSNFVKKTLKYLQNPTDDPYLKKALMVGEDLFWAWGGNYKEEIINGSCANGYSTVGIPYENYNVTRLYDLLWENQSWPKIEIINRINSGFNIINHLGHASYRYNMKINNSVVENLTNQKPCFIYSQGCNSGGFDCEDCVAEYFTVKTEHGAFAGIWNARYGWGKPNHTDGPSQRFDREFFDAIFNEGLKNPKLRFLGVANQDSKEDNLYRINENCMRWCYYELNLFGDPQLCLKPITLPDHDISVTSIDLAKDIMPDKSFDVSIKIFNQGKNNETGIIGNISIKRIIDAVEYKETEVFYDSFYIDFLKSNDYYLFNFSISLPRGLYKFYSEIKNVPFENITFNNNLFKFVFVGENHAPENPSRPKKKWIGWNKYEYSTSTIDSDGDLIYYLWYWGSDQYYQPILTGWFGPCEQNKTFYTYPPSNKWISKVEVIAKDIYGLVSPPSDPITLNKGNIVLGNNYFSYYYNMFLLLINKFLQKKLSLII